MASKRKTPAAETFKNRLKALGSALRSNEVDACIIWDRHNTRWLSGFSGTYSTIILAGRRKFFVTDFRYFERVKEELTGWKVVLQKKSLLDTLRNIFKEIKSETVGFEGDIPHYQYRFFRKCAPQRRFIEVSHLLHHLRVKKDAGEIRMISRAATIADKVFTQICGELRPGLTERQVSRLLRYHLEDAGAEGESFPNIVASGPNSAFPHAQPSNRKIRKGDIVTLDFGAVFGGYCSDMTRTFFVGKPNLRSRKTKQLKKIYEIVLTAQSKALAGVKPGSSTLEVDSLARDYIRDAGYGDYFGHGTGHGVGLEIHEAPRLAPGFDISLEPGMVVTVEPGIYVAGLGGVRIEDLAVVTEKGARRLSRSPKELLIL